MATKKDQNVENEPLAQEVISNMNVYQKLSAVRLGVLSLGTEKSGVNSHAEFTYFELADIVPLAEVLFAKFHLFLSTTFADGMASATVTNMDSPEDYLVFSAPFVQIAEPGKFRMNETQGLGAAITYYRRYLYFLVLDLVEADAIDGLAPRKNTDGEDAPAPAPKPASKPATPAERKEIKEELTSGEELATEEQVQELKGMLKALLNLDPEQESFVQEIALKTNSFQKIKAAAYEPLVETVKSMIDAYDTGEEE